MLSSFTTKLALRKVGIKSDTFDFSSKPAKSTNGSQPGLDDEESSSGWPAWMSPKKLPLTAQAWLAPVPPPIPVAECPKIGDLAPLDRDRQLTFGGGRRVVVLFMRCVGCACKRSLFACHLRDQHITNTHRHPVAQKSFLALRTLANKHQGTMTCIAVSHSSKEATRKWLDLLGGAWNVEVVIDEDRALYAAWGLGLGSVWSADAGLEGEGVARRQSRRGYHEDGQFWNRWGGCERTARRCWCFWWATGCRGEP
jgi:hypothetical protein